MSSKRKQQTVEMEIITNGLTPKQVRFVQEYPVDLNATQAAIRAGYSQHTAQEIGSELLSKPIIRAAVERRMAAAAAAAEVSATMVISELHALATADPRDLVSVHRGACRFCWGESFDRQWTRGEYLDAWHAARAADPNAPAPQLRGGLGYDFTREPNAECPECRGVGTERTIVKDTRKLSRGAAKLIAGVKQTRDGIEIKSRDQDGALLALGKVCGIFVDRQEVSGPGGAPLQLQPVAPLRELSPEQLEALIRASGHPVLQGYPADKPLTQLQIEAITGGTTK